MKRPVSLDTCARIGFAMKTPPPEPITPEKLPTPWLADSEWLLEELAKAREQILRIPFRLDNTSDIKSATDRIFSLEKTLRYLLHLHREGQRSFAKQTADVEHKREKTEEKAKIVRLKAG